MTEQERQIIFLLAQKLTGAHPGGTFQHEIFITNIKQRMQQLKFEDLTEYLNFANNNESETARLISMLSIHTTSWFRENPHYVILQKILLELK
jgi:two-component system, chemotaxis family, protein-glutamate methylesterase/glutaminase